MGTNGKFPSSFVFDLKAESSKPALSFFSRHHIKTTKLVELYNAAYAQVDVASAVRKSFEKVGDDVCCDGGEGFCEENKKRRACERDDYYKELDEYGDLVTALYNWQKMLDDADETKQKIIAKTGGGSTILNWFNTEQEKQYIEKRVDTPSDMKENVKIDMAYSGVSPETLQDAATQLDPLLTTEQKDRLQTDLKNTNRIQFSGSSGVYSMTLDRSSSETIEAMTCTNPGVAEVMDKINTILSYGNPSALIGLGVESLIALRERNKGKEKEAAAENERLKEEDDKRKENEKILKQQEEEKAEEEREKKAKEEQEKKAQDEKPKKKKTYPDSPKQKDIGVEKGNTKRIANIYENKKKSVETIDKNKKARNPDTGNDGGRNDAKKRQDKMKEEEYKRQQERDDKSLKDRKQTTAAESATKSQSGGGDEPKGNHKKKKSFAAGAASKFAMAFTSAPMLIAAYFSGCDYTMETGAEPFEVAFEASAFGVGIDLGIEGGKIFRICNSI